MDVNDHLPILELLQNSQQQQQQQQQYDHQQQLSVKPDSSQYVFRPILDSGDTAASVPGGGGGGGGHPQRPPSTSATLLHAALVGGGGGSGSSTGRHTPAVTTSNSVDRGFLRMRISSGGGNNGGGGPTKSQQQQPQQQLSVASPVSLRPKLYMCYRANQDAWSSAGSRHSSRPGSSASSRPPSRCNNNSNGSANDVSVARNLASLSVSSATATREQRHAAFKTQKWSHSFDQGCGVHSAQTSPGSAAGLCSDSSSSRRRRQTSLQQKSLDLDSGVGSITSDLFKSSLQSQCSQGGSWSGADALSMSGGVCSPVCHARQELIELKQEVESAAANAEVVAGSSRLPYRRANPSLTLSVEDDDLSRSSSLPSFPDSFGRQRHLSNNSSGQGVTQGAQQQRMPILESAGDLSCLPGAAADEQLDEEIKMYLDNQQQGQQQQQQEQQHDPANLDLLTVPPPPKKKDSCDSILNGLNEDMLVILSKQCSSDPPPELDISDVIKQEEDGNEGEGYNTADVLIVPSHVVRRPEPVKSTSQQQQQQQQQQSVLSYRATVFPPSANVAVNPAPQERRGRLARSKTMRQKEEEEKEEGLLVPKQELPGEDDQILGEWRIISLLVLVHFLCRDL